jgi:hypothetical protein
MFDACEQKIVVSQGPSETHVLVSLTSTSVVCNVVDSLKEMSQIQHIYNELRSLDYAIMRNETINFLPMKFDSDVLFEFPLFASQWEFPNRCKAWTKNMTIMLGVR